MMRDACAASRARHLDRMRARRTVERALRDLASYAEGCAASPLILDHRKCLRLIAHGLRGNASRLQRSLERNGPMAALDTDAHG